MATDDEILDATWRALCAHGYADMTMQDIADETTKSKAALHYHYDSKLDLLETFLDHVADRFFARVTDAAAATGGDGADRLRAVVDAAFSPPEESGDIEDMQTALLELKTQSTHESTFRERIRETDERFRDLLADIIADGIEDGSVRADVDPEETAHFIVTVFAGAQLRQVSVGESRQRARTRIQRHLSEHVYREASAE
jgi:AcrR family transcriptional regulator